MGQAFIIATTDYEEYSVRSSESAFQRHTVFRVPLAPEPSSVPLFAAPCCARPESIQMAFTEGCFGLVRRKPYINEDIVPDWAWKSEGRRRVEYQKIATQLQAVIHDFSLTQNLEQSSHKNMCRLAMLLSLMQVYWDIDQLIAQRSLYVDECKNWIVYLQCPYTGLSKIIRELSRKLDLPERQALTEKPALCNTMDSSDTYLKCRRALGDVRCGASFSEDARTPFIPETTETERNIINVSSSSDDDESLQSELTANRIASVVNSVFPNVTKQIIIQELGFIHRSLRIKSKTVAMKTMLLIPSTDTSRPSTDESQSVDTSDTLLNKSITRKVMGTTSTSSRSASEEEELLDTDAELDIETVDLFFRKQLPMFLHQEITAEMAAMSRLNAVQNQALSWVRHVRGELRRKYVELMARRLDLEEASTIQLAPCQLQSIFHANEDTNIMEYLSKAPRMKEGPTPSHLEPGNLDQRIKPLQSSLTSVTVQRRFNEEGLFPRPPEIPSPPFTPTTSPPVTFKQIEKFLHACLTDRLFFESVWARYRQVQNLGEDGDSPTRFEPSFQSLNPRTASDDPIVTTTV